MKPLPLAIGAVVIASIFGTGGYLIGKSQSVGNSPAGMESSAGGRVEGRPAAGRGMPSRPIDVRELRANLDAEKSPLARFKLATQNLEAWIATAPKDALDWLRTQQPSERRDEVIRQALAQFSETDPKGAADWAAANFTGDELNNSLIAIAEAWAEQNGQEAANYFLTLAASPQRDAAVENIFFSWASNEPAAALKYISANPSLGDMSPTLQRAALAGWVKSDPGNAVAASLEISRTNQDPGLFANTLANWATMDLEDSSKWLAANVPTGAERAAAVEELAVIYAQQSPDAGLEWLGKLTNDSERNAAASALAATWARSDAAAAAKWAAAQTTLNLSPDAASAIAQNFLRENPAAFEAWRAALPDGPLKSQAAEAKGPEAAEEE